MVSKKIHGLHLFKIVIADLIGNISIRMSRIWFKSRLFMGLGRKRMVSALGSKSQRNGIQMLRSFVRICQKPLELITRR